MGRYGNKFEPGVLCVIAISEHEVNRGRIVILDRQTSLSEGYDQFKSPAWWVTCGKGVKFSGYPLRFNDEVPEPRHSIVRHGASRLVIAQWKLRLLAPNEQTLIHDGVEYLIEQG